MQCIMIALIFQFSFVWLPFHSQINMLSIIIRVNLDLIVFLPAYYYYLGELGLDFYD